VWAVIRVISCRSKTCVRKYTPCEPSTPWCGHVEAADIEGSVLTGGTAPHLETN
jgi:hypothetical protein